MPRDPNRIPHVLRALEAAWRRYPDLRLGQLIENVGINTAKDEFAAHRCVYHAEDDAWEKALWEYAGREEKI